MCHPGRIRGKRHREQKTGHTLWGTAVLLYPAASAGFGVGDLRAALPVNPAAALPTGGEVHRRPLPAPQGRSSGRHPFGKKFSELSLSDPAASYCNGEEGFLRRSFSAVSESGARQFSADFIRLDQSEGGDEEERPFPSRVNSAFDCATGRSGLTSGRRVFRHRLNLFPDIPAPRKTLVLPCRSPCFPEERSFCNRCDETA